MNCLQHCFSEKNSVPGKQVCRFSGAVRNLLTASDTRDFPDNIHVNNDQQLESLHNLMSQLEGKLQSLRSVVKNRTWFRKSKLTLRDYTLSLSNEKNRTKVHFHGTTVTQSISNRTRRDCFSGDNCKVLHPGRGVSFHETNAPVEQDSGLVSRGTYFLFCSVTMESLTPSTFEIFIIMSQVIITQNKSVVNLYLEWQISSSCWMISINPQLNMYSACKVKERC